MPIIELTILAGVGHALLTKLSAGAAYYAAHGLAGATQGALTGAAHAASAHMAGHGIANVGNLITQKVCESAGTSIGQAVLAAHPAVPFYALGVLGTFGVAGAAGVL